MNSTIKKLIALDTEIKAVAFKLEEAKDISNYNRWHVQRFSAKREHLVLNFKKLMQQFIPDDANSETNTTKLTVGNYFKTQLQIEK